MKKQTSKIILIVLLSLTGASSIAQPTPGGIGTANLTGWFRADDLNIGDVTAWSTTFPSGSLAVTVTDPQAPYPQLTANPVGAISNYNRTIEFSGNTYAGLNLATVQGLSLSNPPEFLKNATTGNQGSFFCAYYLPQPSTGNGHMMLYNHSTDAIQLRNLNASGRIAIGLLTPNSLNASRDWSENFRPNLTSYKGNRSSSTSMKAYNKANPLSSNVASQSSGSEGLSFGFAPSIGTSAYNGYLHEFIFFNRDLTDSEMNQVHTYLALKYGITLSNQGGGNFGDYTATDGTLLWDADDNPTYHNDVIGIGRDDIEGLYQKQSHSFDDSLRIYIDALQTTNEVNIGDFNADISYVTIGHNAALLCGTPSSNAEAPTGITSRLAREFKVTKTNFNQEMSLDIQIDTCQNIDAFANTNNLRLLVSQTSDFSNALAYSFNDGLNFSILDGRVTIGGIDNMHLPNNSTRYLTLGYLDVDFTIQGSGPICEGESSWIIIDLINSSGPIQLNYSDGVNQIQLTNVMDGDTLFHSPSTNTTYTFEALGGIFNCCTNANSYSHDQLVLPTPSVTISATSSNICIGDQVTLTATGANNYQWNNGVTNNQAFTPNQSNLYTVIGTNNQGCTDTASIQIDVLQYPVLSLNNAPLEICVGEPITYSASGAMTYIWNNGIQNGFEFTPNVGTYINQVIGFNGSCTDTLEIGLTVFEQPIADASSSITAGIAPLSVDFTNFSSFATEFHWDFGNGLTSNNDNSVSTTYSEGGTYFVTLTASNELCTSTWSETVTVENGEIIISLPNIFSPNNDGINDVYFIQHQNLDSIEGSILNRWGNTVFEFNTLDFNWDGSSQNNTPVTEGVYSIIYRAKGIDGKTYTGQGFIQVNK